MQASKDGSHLIVPGDYLQTLENCEGRYVCPMDANGNPLGPVVGYTGNYDAVDGSKKNWVGLEYLNFAKADLWPAVLTFYADPMAKRLQSMRLFPDVILGAPWAAIKFSQEVARLSGCRHIFAEKETIGFNGEKKIDQIIVGRYEGEIRSGDRVVIGEELVNNRSTTGKLVSIIEAAGATVIAIICAINRSSPFVQTLWDAPAKDPIPILGVIEREIPQYKQDDPLVSEAIQAGQVIWKPKYDWDKLYAAMATHRKAIR